MKDGDNSIFSKAFINVFNAISASKRASGALSKSEDLVRIALFDKLDYEARIKILTTRQNVLQEQLTAIQSLDVVSPFVTEVVEFTKSRIEHELHWITSLMKKI